jgi:hypothetical protein
MAIIGQEIEGYAVNQINARQVLHGSGNTSNRSTDQISVLNANSSWVSLASGVSISGSKLTELGLPTSLKDMGLAQANVLFSGTSRSSTQGLKQKEGFLQNHRDSSYTYGDYGYSPMPGITSVDVKTLNRGSLKKATVKIKINNRQQFDIIDVLYLRLGYTVLLEWGNSLFTTNGHDKLLVEGTLLENVFFNSAFNGSRSYRDILTPISLYRFRYNGNYDALLGKVSNFNWSFNPDGSYDAEITIISLGDVIESLKLNIPTNKQLNAFILKVSGEIETTDTNPGGTFTGTTAYPEFTLTVPPPPSNLLTYKNAIIKLKALTDLSTAKAVFAIMWAEASKDNSQKSFRSAGGYNYAGVQTDGSRWGFSDPIIGRYLRTDVGENVREFAIFKDDDGFLEFMISRVKAKGFNGNNGDSWTDTYIQKWWSPLLKPIYRKGSLKFSQKLAIYNTAISIFNTP